MIRSQILVKNYCEGFIYYVRRGIGLQKCVEEAKALKVMAASNPGFLEILTSPAITKNEKFRFVDEVLKGRFSDDFVFFIKLVVHSELARLLVQMVDYLRVNYSHGEAQDAVLKSANFLDVEVIKEIEEKVQEKLGKKLFFYFQLDPSLLGGVQLVIGNTVIDGSVKKRMEELRAKVKQVRMLYGY